MKKIASEKEIKNLAKGCLVGAMVGDALGAPLEFDEYFSNEKLESSLAMNEMGSMMTGKGQCTDDTEMSIALGRGLQKGKNVLDLEKIAASYLHWLNSFPFDIGNTIKKAFGYPTTFKSLTAVSARSNAKNYNSYSLSNGSLMRISPLAIWMRKLTFEEIADAVKEEVILTHSHPDAINAAFCYCTAIRVLLDPNTATDRIAAYQQAKKVANPNIQEWFNELETNGLSQLPIKGKGQNGFLKNAFCMTFFYLKSELNFMEVMKEVLQVGGDTDTNACIVGAVIGATVGFEKIPKDLTKKVLSFNPASDKGLNRIKEYVPKFSFEKIFNDIFKNAPKKLKIVGGSETP